MTSHSVPMTHPRLYFTPAELKQLRARRTEGFSAVIYHNLVRTADWCLTRPLRKEWIAPVTPDPIYANLYDRFYAMMHDMAVMEHLAFAWAYSEDSRYLVAAKDWTLACVRVWQREADGAPDKDKAYAVLRLLKGVATAYDMIYGGICEAERTEIRIMLTEVGGKYYQWYLDYPTIGTLAGQGPHHASVETTSFGIAALALLGEAPGSEQWLRLMVDKHRQSLLPNAIAPDGAQIEGATFWASTMQYRIAFMDALRRVTGEDLFGEFAAHMDGRLALASIAAPKTGGHDQNHETVVLEPSYGQINYYSPVLLALARVYRKPLYQYLALWDQTLGSIQQTRYITDNGERMLFDWGGYAYAWYDSTVPAAVETDAPLSFSFPSVNEAYLRDSYVPNGLVAGMRRRAVVIHAGGRPVYADHYDGHKPSAAVTNVTLEDDGKHACLTCKGAADSGFTQQTLLLHRPGRLTLTRDTNTERAWWCYGKPVREGNVLRWEDGTVLEVMEGSIKSFNPQGHTDYLIVGLGLLDTTANDPHPRVYPTVTAAPSDACRLIIKIRREEPIL